MLSVAFVLLLALQEPGKLQMEAALQKCFPDQHTCTLTGNVVVTYEDTRVESDSLTVNDETNDVTTDDPVKFTRPDEMMEGDHLEMNLKTKAGTMRNVEGHVGLGYY